MAADPGEGRRQAVPYGGLLPGAGGRDPGARAGPAEKRRRRER